MNDEPARQNEIEQGARIPGNEPACYVAPARGRQESNCETERNADEEAGTSLDQTDQAPWMQIWLGIHLCR